MMVRGDDGVGMVVVRICGELIDEAVQRQWVDNVQTVQWWSNDEVMLGRVWQWDDDDGAGVVVRRCGALIDEEMQRRWVDNMQSLRTSQSWGNGEAMMGLACQ